MKLTVKTNVPASEQESSFMNATLTDVRDNYSISVAVDLPFNIPAHVDLDNRASITAWARDLFASALKAGCMIGVQVGPTKPEED